MEFSCFGKAGEGFVELEGIKLSLEEGLVVHEKGTLGLRHSMINSFELRNGYKMSRESQDNLIEGGGLVRLGQGQEARL